MDNTLISSFNRINTGRQPEVDLGKAVMLFLLPFIHVTILMTPDDALDHGMPYFFDTIAGGPFAAPMFIMAMGIGVVYSSKSSAKEYLIKGIGIFVSGFIVNFFAEGIPRLIAYNVTGDEAYSAEIIYRVFGDNVLQFSGIAIIFTSLLIYLKVSETVVISIAAVLSLFSNLFYETDLGSDVANIIGGHFVGTQNAQGLVISDFPFTNWFIVFIAGYIFARRLIQTTDKTELYKKIFMVTAPVSVVYLVLGIHYRIGMFGPGQDCYYHARTHEILMMICFNLAMLSIYYFISLKLPKAVQNIAYIFSKNILQYYCVHLTLVSVVCIVFASAILGIQVFTMPQILIVSFAISIVSVLLANLYTTKIKPLFRRKK